MPEVATMPDLDAAMAKLEAAEAAETPPPAPAFEQREADPNAPAEQPPGEQPAGEAQPSNLPDDGTPAAAEPEPAPEAEVDKPADQPPAKPAAKPADKAPDKGAFAKDQDRREKTWKNINERKTALDRREGELKAREDYLARQEQTFKESQAKASNRYTPEQYEESSKGKVELAQNLELQADGLDKRADQLEEGDKFAEAEQMRAKARELREDAAFHKGAAKRLKEMAQHARENPDPTAEQVRQRNQQAVKDYTMEAAKAWPDMAKEGSPFQRKVVEHLQAARKAGLDVNDHPVLIYHAARLTAAEAAAASVPALTKELGELRAKVKELEAFATPAGGDSAPAQVQHERQLSEEEEGAQLRTMAANLS